MIIKNKIDNEPILSNVGDVSEFRIRNSAKAFAILSSGLYANKIRAIIREYSCNAIDSHTEAGNLDTPFDVHLPNALEPWFSVRDYGVGLDEQQVRNIFTTYFESTKTETDDLIGGLGLGSKSAFSFTENFTIVAIKHGIKRVFTAFLNEQGVPSVVQMAEEASNEPAGVEIRFAVEDSADFRKFQEEARHVYKHFKHRPVVSGAAYFEFVDPVYEERDIVPGIHAIDTSSGYRSRSSYAIMGNIEYPLLVPANADLGGLERLLDCGLMIEFAIGELDIQASREGLSYIPETIAAIKTKLEALNSVLADKIADEANKIKNKWERAYFLYSKGNSNLWREAVKKYITDTNFSLVKMDHYLQLASFSLLESEIAKRFNIKIASFSVSPYGDHCTTINPSRKWTNGDTYEPSWEFHVDDSKMFVVNDTSIGALNRAKYHWRSNTSRRVTVYVLQSINKKKEMKTAAFFRAIGNPPATQINKASELSKQERNNVAVRNNVTILKLTRRDNHSHARSQDMVWRDAGNLSAFDDAVTYYYLPMSGYQCQGVIGKKGYDTRSYTDALRDAKIVNAVYGVRKADLDSVKEKKNWINLDEHMIDVLTNYPAHDKMAIIKNAIDFDSYFHTASNFINDISIDSPYRKFYEEFANVAKIDFAQLRALKMLNSIYSIESIEAISNEDEIKAYKAKRDSVVSRYSLIEHLNRYFTNWSSVAEYVNAIDAYISA